MADTSALRGLSSTLVTPVSTSADKLLAQAKSSASDNKKIDKSAKDFESILLGNWLQGAESSFAKVPGTDDDENGDEDSGGSQFLDIAMQSLGGSLAASGGIGIGKMIAQQLHKTEDNKAAAAPATQP